MPIAVYAGSFDPITLGHVWMIRHGAALFDQLIVAIGDNPDKRYTFPREQRLDFLRDATREFPGIAIDSFENRFLVDYVRAIGATHILRGIRNEHDYAFERTMRHINGDVGPEVTTVFLMPPRELAEISSSMVKGLVGPSGWESLVSKYTTEMVFNALRQRHERRDG